MRSPLVFSFVKEQKTFLTLLMSLLTFLSVLSLGLVISLSTAIIRWNAEWSLMATVQVMPGGDAAAARRIITAARTNIASTREISEADARRMLQPWLQGGEALAQYIPQMTEIRFRNRPAMGEMSENIRPVTGARFVRHNDAMTRSASIGWRVIMLSVFVLALVLGAVVVCISYITRNITLIHKRELEILNQIGAKDSFVAAQLMIIIARICVVAAAAGFAAATPALLVISGIASSMKVGMFSQMAIPAVGWAMLVMLAAGIVVLSVWTARRTAIDILKEA
jgi:cell division protein FtsX